MGVPRAHASLYHSGGDVLLAACDEDLLGRVFREKDLVLRVSETFYGGSLVELDELAEMMKKATLMNLVGENVVSLALRLGYVHEEAIIRVGGIPHAQVVVVRSRW